MNARGGYRRKMHGNQRNPEHRAEVLQAQSQAQQEQLAAATAKIEGLMSQVREHELVAAAALAKLAAQEGIAAELRGYLSNRQAGGE